MQQQMDETRLNAKHRVMVIYYYVMFVVALIGMVLHFPKRDSLAAAAYRQQNRINETEAIESEWQ